MTNRILNLLFGLMAFLIGATLVLRTNRIAAMLLGVAWLLLGVLAWRDARRSRRRFDFSQVVPPPMYVGERQYPLHHWKVIENSPQSELD